MAVINNKVYFVFVLLTVLFKTGVAVKCFHCNSANNSACLDMHLHKMHAIVPIVDCTRAMPSAIAKEFFCRKITQTILHVDHTPEVRITRGCGWVKSKRACYTNDNKDHLETVCQCFGDMCNAAAALRDVRVTVTAAVAAMLVMYRTWRGNF